MEKAQSLLVLSLDGRDSQEALLEDPGLHSDSQGIKKSVV